jgi:hypothetical protein
VASKSNAKKEAAPEAAPRGFMIDPGSDPQVRELTVASDRLVALSETYFVATNDQYRQAADDRKNAKGIFDRLEESRLGMTRPLDSAKAAIMAFFTPAKQRVSMVIALIDAAMLAYQDEQKRLERIEQTRLEEIARKQRQKDEERAAETRRKADEKATEERRLADESRREEEKQRRAAQDAADAGDRERAEAAQRLAAAASKSATKHESAAVRTQERGMERAAVHQDRAATTIAPMVSRPLPKTPGVHTTGYWTFEIVDASKIPAAYLIPDEAKIGRVVRAVSGEIAIPGIRVYEQKTMVGSAK